MNVGAGDMTRFLDEDDAALHTVQSRSENGTLQTREVTILSESGLYHALLKSHKREAKPFRKWVTEEVLPAIQRQWWLVVEGKRGWLGRWPFLLPPPPTTSL